MNDFNRWALPAPCLRLDFGFGEQWESIELGDGTGYVRLADYEKAVAENAKLRELVRELYDSIDSVFWDGEYATRERFEPRMSELGIEVG